MGGCSGGALAAAVSNAGGLGLVGGGRASVAWCREQVAFVVGHTEHPWGVGFLTWAVAQVRDSQQKRITALGGKGSNEKCLCLPPFLLPLDALNRSVASPPRQGHWR